MVDISSVRNVGLPQRPDRGRDANPSRDVEKRPEDSRPQRADSERGQRAESADVTRRLNRPGPSNPNSSQPVERRNPGADSLETDASRFVERSVDRVKTRVAERASDVTTRREAIREQADDPAAIRRAAQDFVRNVRVERGR